MSCIVVVTHQIQVGRMEEAQARIDSNGVRMSEATGFISRHLMVPHEGSNQISTITMWDDHSDYAKWQEENRKSNVHVGKETPYVGSPQNQIFTQIGVRTASR